MDAGCDELLHLLNHSALQPLLKSCSYPFTPCLPVKENSSHKGIGDREGLIIDRVMHAVIFYLNCSQSAFDCVNIGFVMKVLIPGKYSRQLIQRLPGECSTQLLIHRHLYHPVPAHYTVYIHARTAADHRVTPSLTHVAVNIQK